VNRIIALAAGLFALAAHSMDIQSRPVVPEKTFPNNHASTLAELRNGWILTCWFTGSREAARDVEIVCSRRQGEGAWTAPAVAVKKGEGGKFVGNPSLLLDDEGTLWLFYEAVRFGGHSGAYIDYKTSKNEGLTWSEPKRLEGAFGNFGNLPRNKALRISANRFLLPVYREFTSHYGYVFDLTLRGGKIQSRAKYVIPGEGHGQPSLVRLGANRVGAYLRAKRAKRILFSELDLTAKKWTDPVALDLPNPDASVDAINVPGGVLLAYNDSETGRTPLSLALSKDGIHFEKVTDVATGEGSFAYPTLLLAADGLIHLTYTYNRDTIHHAKFRLPTQR
jgi:predicted neuraminidase